MSSPGFGGSVVQITVGIDSAGNPTVDQTDVTLWSTKGDSCKWVSANIPFMITFAAGTPFANSNFSDVSGTSGAIQTGATGPYKYSVRVGTKILDPRLIVRP
jgi:hypothetical protein